MMRARRGIVAAAACGCVIMSAAISAPEEPLEIDFSGDTLGKRPEAFYSIASGRGDGGKWVVVEDGTSPGPAKRAAAQVAADDDRLNHYALLVYRQGNYRNFDLTTLVTMEEGPEEASAGVAFRYSDADNYYVVEASASDGAFTLYKLVEGKREIVSRVYMLIDRGAWHELKIVCNDFDLECFLNGSSVVKTRISQFWKGRVGFWTRADTRARFALLSVRARAEKDLFQEVAGRIFNPGGKGQDR